MIADSANIEYVHEPFNLNHKHQSMIAPNWFQYISESNEIPFCDYLESLFDSKINQTRRLFSPEKPILIKDPIAIFSAEWLADNFDMNVIVMIRHPAAFVQSIRRLNWTHDFNHFSNQPTLIKDHLSPFYDEIERYSKKTFPLVDQGILLWKLIYYVVVKYRKSHRNWLFLRHEDLCSDPLEGFSKIFKFLGIKFSAPFKEKILIHSDTSNPLDGNFDSIKRDSTGQIKKWKSQLSKAELNKIKASVESIAQEFYTEEDW
jgi:hypothetical protein